ncbi:Uma2 family endonuclease [Granulicella tundricola]|uniref:Putative restriction endonuclease domain-containing protein n=1 Tax=Granulicella tundricola (strain ATCC BAA-1859 / DSM 23138 / MP5ACTX9) TaxID=1198114 RepID=E8X2W0_GRATM|nr:Uma2 family endonuclease [Granulicella tundricola]ADW68094.1 protein of unknown function DUF820 [Granulicella tundricola MP5ACTX9]
MADDPTNVAVPLQQYLETAYRPDRDWIAGEVRERHVGEQSHASVQGFLTQIFRNRGIEWQIRAFPEQRVQTSKEHFLIADLCVVSRTVPLEPVVRTAPLLCVEILSREDKMSEIQLRVDDYLQMGATAVWVIDPRRRDAHLARAGRTMERHWEKLIVPGTPIVITLAEMFSELDELEGAKG